MIDKAFLWCVIALLSATLYAQNQQLKDTVKQVEIAHKAYDSLRQEQLPLEIQLGRYEVTLEILEHEMPGLAYEFNRIMSERTE